ncbi:hypothetical protein [Paraburkholderia diazotrophica]|uniref:glycine-rich domain-containing protein n=1 Tax=Paraburkholderia diazotrophica TaxID=667676 RepID=UPI0031708920
MLIALGKTLSDMLGTSTLASGLGCVPTAPASLNVQVQPGQLYALQNLDGTPYSSLVADTTHQIVKQGILLDAATFACVAPTTAGYSINYLIEANYADVDSNPTVLAFYNASNPSQAFSGPGGNGQPSMTTRAGRVVLTLKAGVAAATGSQITPAVDAGCIGLWVVTVANGQATITAGNISQYAGAPILPTSLLQSIINNNLEYGIDNGTANAVQATFPLPPTAVADNQQFWVKIKNGNTGATTFTPNPGVVAAAPVVGGAHQALQGGELAANGRALFLYRSDIASYVLEGCTGAALQVGAATQSQHAMQLGQATGRLLNIQVFNSNGTYTPTAGTKNCRATVVGGGASGGGAAATTSGQFAVGAGGGGGAFSIGYYPVASLAGQSVTIGSGGASASANGNPGGSSSIGSVMTAAGGVGGSVGLAATSFSVSAGGSGGTIATGGNVAGGLGGPGGPGSGSGVGNVVSGAGGSSQYSGGTPGVIAAGPGNLGSGPGCGGAGALSQNGSAAQASGAGSRGIVIIEEFA